MYNAMIFFIISNIKKQIIEFAKKYKIAFLVKDDTFALFNEEIKQSLKMDLVALK